MPHGTPDWGLVGPKSTTYGLDDLGELAVRLGSPHLYDRRGDTLLLTDFHNGIGAWENTSVDGNHSVHLYTGHSRQGSYSVQLYPGAGPNFDCALIFEVAPPVSSALGMEISFSLDGMTRYIDLEIKYYNGVRYYHAILRYDNATNRVMYWNDTGNWTVLAMGVVLDGSEQPIHVMKLVVDMATQEYIRCIIDNTTYLMTGLRMHNVGPIPSILVMFYINLTTMGAAIGEIYVDNIIITQNEPI